MGNKSSSTLISINDELCNRKKNKSQRTVEDGEAVILLDNILECVGSYSTDSVKLNSKDVKLLSSIASHLSEEFGGVVTISCRPSEMSARLRAVAVIHRILQITFVAKNALENCASGLVNCISPLSAKLTCLTINCICAGLVSLNDDACKCTILLQLETLGFYKMMLEVFDSITKKPSNVEGDGKLQSLAFLACVQHLVWVLGQQILQSSPVAILTTIKSFQKRLSDEISKHQDVIFRLTRDKERPVRFAATILLIKLLNTQDRRQCAYLQVNARNKGLVLWTLQRLAELSLDAKSVDTVRRHNLEDIDNDTSVAANKGEQSQELEVEIPESGTKQLEWFRPQSVEGVDLETCESEVATAESTLDSVRLLLTLLCLGDKANEAAIFRLLPESFSSFVTLQPSFDMIVSGDENPNVTISGLKTRPPPPGFFGAMKAAPQVKKLFTQQSSSSLQRTDSSVSCSVQSNGSPEGTVAVDPGSATRALLKAGGSEVRVAFAAKMGVHDKGSWHVLFAVLCEDFESPKMVWNDSTLRHLALALNDAVVELDSQRAISYEPWDVRSIDVTYPLYSSRQYLSVRGVFLPQLIGELKEQGRTFFLDDPHGTLWAILDRATVEAERVFGVLLSAYGGEEGSLSDKHSDGDFLKDLTIYLEAVLLLLARYHPEVHRVTPVYGLCGVLGKGVTVLNRIFEADPAVKRFNNTKEEMEDLVFNWMNITLGILQCRLSGPISRDDWSDFAAAGGVTALCVILSDPLHRSGPTPNSPTGAEQGSAVSRAVLREDELLILSAQLLKNLVVSGTKYALAFANPAGLEQLSVAMWLLYKRGQHVNRTGSGQISSNSGKKDVLGAAPSTSDTAGSHNPADVLSALPSLVCVSQRVCDASHWKFRRDSDASENPSTLLLADKLLLLVRVIVASAIYTDPGSPHSPSSIGALNVTSAKLLRDLLTLTDSLTLAWSVVDMSAPHQKSESSPIDGLERLRDVLHSAIPERLLTLCRRLSPSDFIDVFNTEVEILSPSIIWSPILRQNCLESITEDLGSWEGRIPLNKGQFPPELKSAGCPSVEPAENGSLLCAHRFPLLQSQSEVSSLYLQCFLHCQRSELFLPLDAPAFAVALSSEAWGTTDHLPSNVPVMSDGEYRCAVHLCLSRLIQIWSQDLSVDLWCEVLAPTLLSTMTTCTEQLAVSTGRAKDLPPAELIRCCISCVVTLASYLRANMSPRGSKSEVPRNHSAQKSLVAVGGSCSELLDAFGLLLSDLVLHCVGVVKSLSSEHLSVGEESSKSVYTSSVQALEATAALIATMSLLLGEDAHIERVRLREFLSRQAGQNEATETLGAASKGDTGIALQTTNLKLRSPSVQSMQLEQLSYVETVTPIPSTPRTPRTPGTPCLLAETAKRLDIARQALRKGNNRLLASLVSCCQIDVAKIAPKATLSALTALHLLIGMEADDEEPISTRSSSIFLAPHPRSLVDILYDFGLPGILLETTVLFESLAISTSELKEPKKSTESHCLLTHRWSTHPLFTSDRFIQSTVPPVQFLSSPRNRSRSAAFTEGISTSEGDKTVLESLPKVLHSILDDVEYGLKSDFTISSSQLKPPSPSRARALTVARECVELMRLMAICPASSAVQSLSRSLGSISPSNSFGSTNDVKRAFPINMTTFSLSLLNFPLRSSLEQYITPPMVFVMMTDAPLFLRSLNTPVPILRPLLVWDERMRRDLLAVLETENRSRIATLGSCKERAVSLVSEEIATSSTAALTAPDEGCAVSAEHELARTTLHSYLSSECLVDNVYIKHIAPRGKRVQQDAVEGREENCADDIGVRDLARFLENLQASISSSKVVIKHVQNTSNATQLVQLKAQLALKEKVLTEMLADHDELGYGYSDLYLDS